MERPSFGAKTYHIVPKNRTPPDYVRVVRSLSDPELVEEVARGIGDPGYRAALAAESKKRGIRK